MSDIHTGFKTQSDDVLYVVAFNVSDDGAVIIIQGALLGDELLSSNSTVYSTATLRAYSQ